MLVDELTKPNQKMNVMKQIIFITFVLVAFNSKAQCIITFEPMSMLQKTMRPSAVCDSLSQCDTYKDSMYFTTLDSKKHLYGNMVSIGYFGSSKSLDTLSTIVKTFTYDTNSKAINMRVRVFDCNEQILQINLSESEAKEMIKTLLTHTKGTELESLFLNFTSD